MNPERVTLTDEEREAVVAVNHCTPDGKIMEALVPVIESILAAREQALREAYDVAAGEWSNDYADWMANNPGPSGIPSDPPMLDTYLARGGTRPAERTT